MKTLLKKETVFIVFPIIACKSIDYLEPYPFFALFVLICAVVCIVLDFRYLVNRIKKKKST